MDQGSPWRTLPLYRGILPSLVALLAISCGLSASQAASRPALPPLSKVKQVIDHHFAEMPGYRRGDIIAKGDVQPLFAQLKQLGWVVADRQAIEKQLLADSHAVVTTLRTQSGRRFMRKVSGNGGIYDRLDRISRESGGKQLIRSLVKLPDGERYAKSKSARGVPGMLEFLPKKGSSKSRKVADYDKPTGQIYTVDQLTQRLEESYARAKKEAAASQ